MNRVLLFIDDCGGDFVARELKFLQGLAKFDQISIQIEYGKLPHAVVLVFIAHFVKTQFLFIEGNGHVNV